MLNSVNTWTRACLWPTRYDSARECPRGGVRRWPTDWSLSRYLIECAVPLIPLWLIIFAFIYMARNGRRMLQRLLRCLPILRAYSHAQALADLAYSLGTFIAAGVPVPSAWRLSVKLVDDPRYRKAAVKLEPVFAAGQDPSTVLRQIKYFPSDFIAFYRTGAESGQLDSSLLTVGRQYQERANRSMTMAALAYPAFVFAAVAALVILNVFRIFGGYLEILEAFAT